MKCTIMERMKSFYEERSRTYLTRKIPVICRLDGKSFHSYCKSLDKPFDEGLIEDMQKTALYLCENIQGAKCAYVQSDEISLLVTDYDKIDTQAWFDYEVQKMISVSSSFATARFNQLRLIREMVDWESDILMTASLESYVEYFNLANFDSRVFSIPKEDVANYFLARQLDAEKNSIHMLARSLYGHKELHGKHGGIMQEMCFQKGHNWNDLHFSKKRGSFIVKNTYINNRLMYFTSNIFHPYRSNPNICESNIGDLLYNPESKSCIERQSYINEDGEPCVVFADLEKPTIRTKWEVVETPMRFNNSHFEQWL